MRLILIRHGQTPANVDGILATVAPGPGLTALGHDQAKAVPDALAGESIDSLSVSTLVRTHLTAAPLAGHHGLTPVVDGDFREIEAGDLEDRADEEAYAGYIGPVYEWVRGNRDARILGGPDGHEFFARYDAAVSRVVATGVDTAVVVSHGAAIRVWATARARNLPSEWVADHNLGNTGIVILEGDPVGGWTVISWEGEPVTGPGLDEAAMADPTGRA